VLPKYLNGVDGDQFFSKKGYDMKTKQIVASIFFVIFNLVYISSFAATYYVNGSAANDSGTGAENNPKKYITSGIKLMSGGDTLIIEDGTYTGANNMIGDYSSPQVFPPSGSAGNHTIIKARNIGGAIIDGEHINPPFSTGYRVTKTSYIKVDGIHFKRGGRCLGAFNIKGDYNKITNCGFEDGQAASDNQECPIAYIAGGSTFSLVEDSWAWGKGRYGIYFSSTEGGVLNSILRRVVVRQDDTPSGWVTAGIQFYKGDSNVCQNCIVLDTNTNIASGEIYGAFSTVGNTSVAPNMSFYGIIALNNPRLTGFFPQDTRFTTIVDNSIFWANGTSRRTQDGGGHGFMVPGNAQGTFNVSHVTSGANGGPPGGATAGSGFRSFSGYPSIVNVTDSIAVNNTGYGFTYINSVGTANIYGNIFSVQENTTISKNITTNPMGTALKYLPRIEVGSNLKGAGVGGSDIGANVLYQIGGSGTLYGEVGWNVTTTTPLWPFAHESIWAAKMKAYTASGLGGNRGFAALSGSTVTPLTDYIWGYLGNPKPANMYGSSPAPDAPQKLIKLPVPPPTP